MGCIRGRPWSPEDKENLKKWYPKLGIVKTSLRFGRGSDGELIRTPAAVQRKACLMKIPGKRKVWPTWTREEEKILREGWQERSMKLLKAQLKGRTLIAIEHQATQVMKLGPRFHGQLSLLKACGVLGVSYPTLLTIARVEQVHLQNKRWGCKGARRVVGEEEITEAYHRFFRRENRIQFEERSGIPEKVVTLALVHSGRKVKGQRIQLRLLPEEWDGIMENYERSRAGDGVQRGPGSGAGIQHGDGAPDQAGRGGGIHQGSDRQAGG